jgi:hypothetical protein
MTQNTALPGRAGARKHPEMATDAGAPRDESGLWKKSDRVPGTGCSGARPVQKNRSKTFFLVRFYDLDSARALPRGSKTVVYLN